MAVQMKNIEFIYIHMDKFYKNFLYWKLYCKLRHCEEAARGTGFPRHQNVL